MALLQEIVVPLLAVNDTTLTVVEINYKNGQEVKKGSHLMVFETSKTTYDVESEADGYICFLCETGQDYEVNTVVAKIFSEALEAQQNLPALQDPPKKESSGTPSLNVQPEWKGETLFSRDAIELMEASGLVREHFSGKDFVGREQVQEKLGIKKVAGVNDAVATPSIPVKNRPGLPVDHQKVVVEKLTSNKRREIEYLSEVQATGLTSTINSVVETEGIFTHINESLTYLKNSLLPVIIYESARLLLKYPALNAYFTGEGTAFYKQVHIGFAIDIDKGLKVLKVDNADSKTINEIEDLIMVLSGKYLDDGLSVADLVDITFTVTDLSAEGVASFRPLVNMMNSAILGVSSIDEKLQRCTLSLTFDHRVTEGKTAARFLHELKDRLESYQSKNHPRLNLSITCIKCYKTLGEDLADTGFVKCITPEGREGYLCQACLNGF